MFKGSPIGLGGPEIKPGQDAPDFTAVDNGLQPVKLSASKGKVLILSAVPSARTPVCDMETRKFNEEAGKLGGNVEVWTITWTCPCPEALVRRRRRHQREDALRLPRALVRPELRRACEGGPAGRPDARAVFVVGKDGKVKHAQTLKEIMQLSELTTPCQRCEAGGRG